MLNNADVKASITVLRRQLNAHLIAVVGRCDRRVWRGLMSALKALPCFQCDAEGCARRPTLGSPYCLGHQVKFARFWNGLDDDLPVTPAQVTFTTWH